MAPVKISHDALEEAKVVGSCPHLTGRLRWWKPLDGPEVLQCEWADGFNRVWIDVPTLTEIRE